MNARFRPFVRSTALLLLALSAGSLAASAARAARPRDLVQDERRGGHTLARHVGKSDAELRERLRREPGIAAASTWTDRATAEAAIASALAASRKRLDRWTSREGSRANLVIDWPGNGRVLGRSLRRGDRRPVPCTRALIVLKWDDGAEIFYVLTSYPEASR